MFQISVNHVIVLIIKDRKRLFPKKKTTRLLIKNDSMKKIIKNELINLNELNNGIVLKVT